MKVLKKSERELRFPELSIAQVRDELEACGEDRHMMIELWSTEIAIVTPLGLMMQVRKADHSSLGCWGGGIEGRETPFHGAIRELREEIGGIFVDNLTEKDLMFYGTDDHTHQYGNGDMALFHAYRFVVLKKKLENFFIDPEESLGCRFIKEVTEKEPIIAAQEDFLKEVLKIYYYFYN